MYHFDVNRAIDDCCRWIQDWFAANGDGCPAVLGISGGKDSSVALHSSARHSVHTAWSVS